MEEKEEKQIQEILVTRQPIFDKKKDVFAYEVLFQPVFQDQLTGAGSEEQESENMDSDSNLKGVDSFLLTGLKTLSGGKKAFINFNPHMVLTEMPFMFPPDLLGIALFEKPDSPKEMLKALKKVKRAGYLFMVSNLAVDTADEDSISMLKQADIIGCDFRNKEVHECSILKPKDRKKKKFLAKSVETPTDYRVAEEKGYQYFQGDFFCKPDLVPVRNIPSYKVNLLKLLKEINKPDVDVDRIEAILRKDVSITYKLLRFINSANFGFKTTVHSIRHALTLLGEMELRKWLSLIILSGTGTDKPQELIKNTTIRARFCENIAGELDMIEDLPKFFLMGMFSMVEAFLDRPMDEILAELPLDLTIKAALLGEDNRFRQVLDVVRDYERGDWTNFAYSADRLKLDEKTAVTLYLESVQWATLF